MQTEFAYYILEEISTNKSGYQVDIAVNIFLLLSVMVMGPLVLLFIFNNVSSIKVCKGENRVSKGGSLELFIKIIWPPTYVQLYMYYSNIKNKSLFCFHNF